MNENVKNYLDKLKAEEKRAAQEKQKRQLTPERIADQVNNKSNKQLHGKALEYKRQLATCKFKLVVYFNVDKNGRYYTQQEKDANKNRQYIPSFDYVNQGGRQVINHEIAHLQLIDYCLQNASRIQAARLIHNDHLAGEEQTVFIFNPQQIGLSKYLDPVFKDQKETGARYLDHFNGVPFRVDKLREYNP